MSDGITATVRGLAAHFVATEALRAQLMREGGLSASQLLGRAYRETGLPWRKLASGLQALLDGGVITYDTEEAGGCAVTLLWLRGGA